MSPSAAIGEEYVGTYADGIGTFKSIPDWGCFSRSVGAHFKFDIYGGVMFGGQVRVDDSEGGRHASDDYDPAPFMTLTILRGKQSPSLHYRT